MLVRARQSRLCRRGAATIVPDDWTLVEEGPARPGLIAPLSAWLESPQGAGVWVEGDAVIEEVASHVVGAEVIAVRFPAFADGRGLSLGSCCGHATATRVNFAPSARSFPI